jgi:prepilin-type N-terminal cleavage/methylation domain-containing protein
MKQSQVRRGFTLVEVVFAIFIVALSASVLVGGITVGARSTGRGRYRDIALGYAQAAMEDILIMNESQITPANLTTAGIVSSGGSFGTPMPCADTTYSTTPISTALPSGTETVTLTSLPNNVVEVTVTVSWIDTKETRTISLTNCVAQY